ncbi:hypothetical protein KR054_001566 [Drosophila jambulina]|nr:hypothetical protein KR054_001566 [Drosophila jambulina]
MNSLRKVVLLQRRSRMSPRLLSRSANMRDSQKETTKDDASKDIKKEQQKKDFCGKVMGATGPRCKNEPGDGEANDKKDSDISGSVGQSDSKKDTTKDDSSTDKEEKKPKKDFCGNDIKATGPRCKN